MRFRTACSSWVAWVVWAKVAGCARPPLTFAAVSVSTGELAKVFPIVAFVVDLLVLLSFTDTDDAVLEVATCKVVATIEALD